MPAIFEITDGTTTIDLTSPDFGFHLNDWIPVTPGYKGGGTFRSSPLASGRRLVNYEFDNIVDTLDLKVNNIDPDSIIRDFQNMRRLLVKAADYWASDWQGEPVWIKAKSDCETNTRYAIIHLARIPEDDNPFAQPFLQAKGVAAMDNITLLIEHGAWTENQPGTGTAIELANTETYDGRTLGNVDTTGTREPTTDNEVYISNKANVANLTDIYYWDSVGGAWSVNLMDAVLPFDLFQNPVAAGDVIIFGIDTTLANSGPFCSLVFDLVTAQNDLTTVTWRYSDAGVDPTAWRALTVQDNTNADGAMTGDAFDTVGVNSVHWEQPDDWVDTLNPTIGGVAVGITGFWVAAHVVAVGVNPTPPTQQNRDVYSVVWPYVDVFANQVGGDIPALMEMKVYAQSSRTTFALSPKLFFNRCLVGLRSYDRGNDFTAYLNVSDGQLPTGLTCVVSGAMQPNPITPTGRFDDAVIPDGATQDADFTFTPALIQQYYGGFHAYFRAQVTAGFASGITAYIQLFASGIVVFQGNAVEFQSGNAWQALDLGPITIPGTNLVNLDETFDSFVISVEVRNNSGGAITVAYYDLVLVPVDEWAADIVFDLEPGAVVTSRYLHVDSVLRPKNDIRAMSKAVSDNDVYNVWQTITNGKAMAQANARQRYWFFFTREDTAASDTKAQPYISASVTMQRNQQYQSMRGDR
jgi:hypothetical protein